MFRYRPRNRSHPRPRQLTPRARALLYCMLAVILLSAVLFAVGMIRTLWLMPDRESVVLRGNQTRDSQWPAI